MYLRGVNTQNVKMIGMSICYKLNISYLKKH